MTGPQNWCGSHGCAAADCKGPHAQYADDLDGMKIITMPVRTPKEVQAFQDRARKPGFRQEISGRVRQQIAGMVAVLLAELTEDEAFDYLRHHVASFRREMLDAREPG